MLLSKLISGIKNAEGINFKETEVTGISYNSKTTQKGDIFVCLVGENSDGHNFAKMAIDNGAVALMVERKLDFDIPQIKVESTRHQIADLAATFYDYPSKIINMIGVTGTNGKTTVTHLLQKSLRLKMKNAVSSALWASSSKVQTIMPKRNTPLRKHLSFNIYSNVLLTLGLTQFRLRLVHIRWNKIVLAERYGIRQF